MQDESPNFFYAMDLNYEQRLKNVFWVDAKSRLDYGNFSDVVLFDTKLSSFSVHIAGVWADCR